MTHEDKELLLIDLCARKPHGLKYQANGKVHTLQKIDGRFIDSEMYTLEEVKPYLRPVSSMTKEELDKLNEIISKEDHDGYFFVQEKPYYYGLQLQTSDIGCVTGAGLSKAFDYLNSIHVDYRGLIPNLALEAPADMYKTE